MTHKYIKYFSKIWYWMLLSLWEKTLKWVGCFEVKFFEIHKIDLYLLLEP